MERVFAETNWKLNCINAGFNIDFVYLSMRQIIVEFFNEIYTFPQDH